MLDLSVIIPTYNEEPNIRRSAEGVIAYLREHGTDWELLLVDDGFFTLGSANLNQRSMAVDSEINLATNDPRHATALRKRIWSKLATEKNNGGNATPQEIEKTFKDWVKLMNRNKDKQKALSIDPEKKQMKGFIVPLDDRRSSTIRVA